ncbi:hypothetical protein DFA_00874 [Cavenderia fasciculata]|uniref:Translin family protein n=1 Tax=Cavenderia fasciculata TaxID=261658 RepID=F4PUD3_CACFS|nr:uncharacterized protein DFA_00874 [Cavenderia fasciculata]EGG21005.1 hypothetical protein DFA_00874 [Cavenderia fasciculata]|eukprot:XP_004358855.1 hypothetical protein DFA_00874 [Cavenderia fasciculata]
MKREAEEENQDTTTTTATAAPTVAAASSEATADDKPKQPFKYQRKDNNNNNNNRTEGYNNRRDNNIKKEVVVDTSKDTEIVSLFRGFSKSLDEVNDRRERIVKVSRDVTIHSKRLISLLHRSCWEDRSTIMKQAYEDLDKIHVMIGNIINELEGQEYWIYQRNFTMGIQEYIESITYLYFLEDHQDDGLITLKEINHRISTTLKRENLGNFIISNEDYYLGVSDLTGELMRLCTNYISKQCYSECFKIHQFVTTIQTGFKYFHLSPSLESKLNVTMQNLEKIEKICCSIRIRKAEFPNQDISFGSSESSDNNAMEQ